MAVRALGPTMPEPASAPVVYGKYQLLDLLARGGMAEVFKAKSHGVEGFEKILVIKRILPELSRNPQFVEMFINEAKIAVTLSHANIVQVFDLGRADETYFIAMEYVAGYDLATILRRAHKYKLPLSQELAVFVVSELAKGLDYAHRRRDANLRPLHIVHRDVSPQNVLISFEGEVKLTDFGIAKAKTIVDDDDHGVLKGKYAYMSPEQARSEDVDARTDLYALGIVLFEALSGKNPFHTASSYETLKRVRDGAAPPLRSIARDVPEELAAIVDHALRPSAADRHANAGRLYEELVQFLYSSGRRVGGHDLARYLQDLREVSEQAGQEREGANLRAVFEGGADSDDPASRPGVTPVEVPFGRSSRRVAPTTGSIPGEPARRATTGVGDVRIVLRMRGKSLTPCASAAAPRDSRRSMPEQNTGPEWVRTITRTAGLVIAVSRWPCSSRRTCADSALRLRGESSVIVATPSTTTRCTSSSAVTPSSCPGARCRSSARTASVPYTTSPAATASRASAIARRAAASALTSAVSRAAPLVDVIGRRPGGGRCRGR